MQGLRFDVVVAGAGPAGAAAAALLAEDGRRVALVEAGPMERAGARWVDAIPPWMFERAGLDAPEAPELLEVGGALSVGSPGAERRCWLDENPLLNVDMRLLQERLHHRCLAAGVEVFEYTRADGLQCDGTGRPFALRATVLGEKGTEGQRLRLRAPLFVDATGLQSSLLRSVPTLDREFPSLSSHDVCWACQLVFAVADREGAEDFLDKNGVGPGDAVSWVGVEDGYSTLGVHVTTDFSEVGVLAGTSCEEGALGGPALVERFRRENPWIGEVRFGGEGRLPIRGPYARQSAPGLVLIGDAGCQVFPAHGSGVGASLIAARLLQQVTHGVSDPGAESVTWAYQVAFHREVGARHGMYDMFRRMTQSFDRRELGRMVEAGLITPSAVRRALLQKWPWLALGDLVQTVSGAAREPRLAARAAGWVGRMPVVWALHRRHPRRPTGRGLRRWERRLSTVSRWGQTVQTEKAAG